MRFSTKGIYMTRDIQSYLEQGKLQHSEILESVEKHFCNLGHECEQDNKMNEHAIKNKYGRVFSVFNICNHKIYIITDGLHLANDPVHGGTYPMTTILFPDEY